MVKWCPSILAGSHLEPSRAWVLSLDCGDPALAPGHSLCPLPSLAALAGGHHELTVVLRDWRCHRGLVSLRLYGFWSGRTPHLCASPTACVWLPFSASLLLAHLSQFCKHTLQSMHLLQSKGAGAGEQEEKHEAAPGLSQLSVLGEAGTQRVIGEDMVYKNYWRRLSQV